MITEKEQINLDALELLVEGKLAGKVSEESFQQSLNEICLELDSDEAIERASVVLAKLYIKEIKRWKEAIKAFYKEHPELLERKNR